MEQWYATGKRKTAVARVFLRPGKGSILVNGKTPKEYFFIDSSVLKVDAPLEIMLCIIVRCIQISGHAVFRLFQRDHIDSILISCPDSSKLKSLSFWDTILVIFVFRFVNGVGLQFREGMKRCILHPQKPC